MEYNHPPVLIVEPDRLIAAMLGANLEKLGYDYEWKTGGQDGYQAALSNRYLAVFANLKLHDMDSKEMLSRLRAARPELPVAIMAVDPSVEHAVACMKLGAIDFVSYPLEHARLCVILENARSMAKLYRAMHALEAKLRDGPSFGQIITQSDTMRHLIYQARRASHRGLNTLLLGESGTGKELFAHAIHAESARQAGPFVAVNCGAIPEGLLESAFFGHERGAFTGAERRHIGYFEQAHGGTLFLDEIGEMRLDLQVRLLRVLETRRIRRVGGTQELEIDINVVGATNRNLLRQIRQGTFREDLYYRLAVMVLEIPSLRERRTDIALLAQHFLNKAQPNASKPINGFSDECLEVLNAYDWPGNVRELRNVVECALAFADNGWVSLNDLPVYLARSESGKGCHSPWQAAGGDTPGEPADPSSSLQDETCRLIEQALEAAQGNVSRAARALGIHRATIYRKIGKRAMREESHPLRIQNAKR